MSDEVLRMTDSYQWLPKKNIDRTWESTNSAKWDVDSDIDCDRLYLTRGGAWVNHITFGHGKVQIELVGADYGVAWLEAHGFDIPIDYIRVYLSLEIK